MPRAIWNGAISFGLVNVPVQLYSATEERDIQFHQFEEGTGRRIRYKRVAEGTDEEVPYDRITKGYELSRGRYVIVEPEELEAVEPGQSRTIDIEEFIDLDEVDPIYFEKSYYVAPRPDSGAEKSFALLRKVMAETNKAAIGRFVMRTKQYLVAVRPSGDLLLLETMYFPDEIRNRKELEVPRDTKLDEREVEVAERLIDSLTVHWDPDRYHDTYRERVLELVDRKAQGEQVVVEAAPPPERGVTDLMAALEASLAKAREEREQRGDGGKERPGGAKPKREAGKKPATGETTKRRAAAGPSSGARGSRGARKR